MVVTINKTLMWQWAQFIQVLGIVQYHVGFIANAIVAPYTADDIGSHIDDVAFLQIQ